LSERLQLIFDPFENGGGGSWRRVEVLRVLELLIQVLFYRLYEEIQVSGILHALATVS
jgi:hypothetical protein